MSKAILSGLCLGAAILAVSRLAAAGAVAPETQIRYLSGTGPNDAVPWEFFCTEGRRSGAWTTIRVPSCWEQEGFGTYNYGVLFRGKRADMTKLAREQGRYRLSFTVPADWAGRTVRIVFDGSMTDTEVKVNGQPAGPVHRGAFYRFRHDITRFLRFDGPNVLEVAVSKESANPSVNEAERRGDYWNFGGIFRPVYLEALPAEFIDRVAVDARADGQFSADVFLGGAAETQGRITAQIEKLDGTPVGPSFSAGLAAATARAKLDAKLDGVAAWTAETPNLYRVRFTLATEGGDGSGCGNRRHSLAVQFGFRTIEVRPRDGVYLNGRKIVLKGVNRHSFRPETGRALTRKDCYDDVRLIREMNMNAVRMSHYPPDEAFLDACDELGLYVLDEIAGWHGCYDNETGHALVGEMVRRDVNHPSVVFWDNGNEGGFNTALDGDYALWDPQHRTVLHPWETFNGLSTQHYRSYEETRKYLEEPEIFMPTEFLHGLYDGGHGAGLWDYWEMMRKSPRCAGGFLWVFADEGVVRTDENGRVDNQGNLAADGIVGPHHEREGSFNTIREVWSPVRVGPGALPEGFRGVLAVENRYDFNNLNQCRFAWSLARFPTAEEAATGHVVIAGGEVPGPSVAPHGSGELALPLPADWRKADALYVTAIDPAGRPLWTWSWNWAPLRPGPAAVGGTDVRSREEGRFLVVTAGGLEFRFDRATGEIAGVARGGKTLSLTGGPRLCAVHRSDRGLDGVLKTGLLKGTDRKYESAAVPHTLVSLNAERKGDGVSVEARYSGGLTRALWSILPDGTARLDYEYDFSGVVDMIGVSFDFPEERMKAVRWLGEGPFRVWQNRIRGTTFDVWRNACNDPIPGESFTYPEFKGYFRDWRWAVFETAEGGITLSPECDGTCLGVYNPRDGRDGLLYTFPAGGLSVLDVIPPVRNKVNATELIGPSSQPARVQGVHHGSLRLRFDPR